MLNTNRAITSSEYSARASVTTQRIAHFPQVFVEQVQSYSRIRLDFSHDADKNIQAHGDRLEGVVDLKGVPEPLWGTLTRDFEFGMEDSLQEQPWQTEFCIGSWHYNRRLLEEHTYQKASNVIPMFVDIVSKNGNLLLSIPLPGHGEPDSDELAFLNELAEWQQVNSEAIKGTRPWKIYGEGPSSEAKKTMTYGNTQLKFDHTDIRFTTKGEALYAIALGWPTEGKILIKSLAENSTNYPGSIRKVELLGAKAETQVDAWNTGS